MEVSGDLCLRSQNVKENHDLLPDILRMIIVGPSGSGKSTIVFNLLLQQGWVNYDHLIVYCKTLYQPEYELLRKCFELGFTKEETYQCFKYNDIIYEGSREEPIIKAEFHSSDTHIKGPEELPKGTRKLVLFDDVILESNDVVKRYFCMSRHNQISVLLLSQNFFAIDRQCVRSNLNFLILLKQQMKNIFSLQRDMISDLPLTEFITFVKAVWQDPHNFVSIDLTSPIENGRFRKNFNTFYLPQMLFEQ